MENRFGDWIEMYNGEKFYSLDPNKEEIHIENIAHGLSLMCRFNGQSRRFLSVAQHSINVMREVEDLTQDWKDEVHKVRAKLLALLHDSSEALGISDVCSSAKRHMPEYKAIEKKIQDTVWDAFNLKHKSEEYDIVRYVDVAMASYEARELMLCKHWETQNSYLIHCKPKQYIDLSFRDMGEVEVEFLDLFSELYAQYMSLLEKEDVA